MALRPRTVHVEHDARHTHYRFEAELPLLWTERLAAALAARGEDIDQLTASQQEGVWSVDMSVRGRGSLDVLSLVDAAPPEAPSRHPVDARYQLDAFDVTSAADGSLLLVVFAPDRAGFLAFLLRELRTLALFPSHVRARSRGAQAHDELTLVSVGGATPGIATARALCRLLETYMVRPPLSPRIASEPSSGASILRRS